MCGIAGYLSFARDGGIELRRLQQMVRALAHRGPNGSGCLLIEGGGGRAYFADDVQVGALDARGHVGLGHRRLSIIDLSDDGRQPMHHGGSGVWITFNGEIYNFEELRAELEALGHVFHSRCDTEVALAAYVAWGGDCFARFNGMWAMAIWDPRRHELILSRDRYGKKPLYYYVDGERLIFASEIKALFTNPVVPRAVNRDKVACYAARHYRYVDNDEESFFANVRQVPKGTAVTWTSGGEPKLRKYWSLNGSWVRDLRNAEEAKEGFLGLLEDAVRLRLRSDVPVAAMLSGGLDSTSIVALAQRAYPNLHCFSGVTGDGYYDESRFIDAVVRETGVEHTYIRPRPASLFDTVREMLRFHDEPVCTVTWFATYLITREIASRGMPVVLTGHGGDELLAGYWDHYHYRFADLRDEGLDDAPEVAAWQRMHGRPMDEHERERKFIAEWREDPAAHLRRFSPYLDCLSPALRAVAAPVVPAAPYPRMLDRRLWSELLYETVPASLRAEDRNMMAFSLENRVPFLDYRLAEFCFGLDGNCKIAGGLGKRLLRDAMAGILPESVRLRTDKTGFNVPLDEWIRGDNRAAFEALLAADSVVNRDIYDIDEVKRLFRRHIDGENHYMFFWQYLNLSLWFEHEHAVF